MKHTIIILIYLILGGLTIFLFDGTAGAGDSIYHFLYAKEAPQHPTLFFDHWAKPLWVLIAAPFAQFGFAGMKIMNVLAVAGTIYFTKKTSDKLSIKNTWLTGLLLIFSPLYFVLTFSGLTEPLFAFLLILATYLFLDKKWFWSILIISFLPYVRSEGLFFIGIFGFMLIWLKKWKYLPILLLGSVAYGIAGYPIHGDLLWVFNKVPYAKMSSTYGEGNALHFVNQLLYVVGIPFYIFIWLGILAWFRKTWKEGFNAKLTFIIYGGAVSFILAHSIFWYFGIFNSMGLNRVLICIIPFLAIIALIGINTITEDLLGSYKKIGTIVKVLLFGYLIVFPFTSNPAALDLNKELNPNTAEQAAQETAAYITENYEDYRIVTANIHFCQLLEIDCFDSEEKVFLNNSELNKLRSNDLVIWENWFAVVEQAIGSEQLDQHPQLKRIKTFQKKTPEGNPVEYIIYEVQ